MDPDMSDNEDSTTTDKDYNDENAIIQAI